jgi:hypothetical protein
LEAELQELKDAYAECLGDYVEASILSTLWLRIKALTSLYLNQTLDYSIVKTALFNQEKATIIV